MKARRAVADVASLPTVTFGPASLSWWGTLGFMTIEGTTLVICVVTYFYLRKNFQAWPPFGSELPGLRAPITNVVLMLASIAPMAYAARAARRLDLRGVQAGLAVELLFKVAILVVRWHEFRALHTLWNSNAYGSIAWNVLGFHTSLLILDLAEDAGLLLILLGSRANARHFSDVADDAMYWYFTVASWIPLFVTVFLTPRWM